MTEKVVGIRWKSGRPFNLKTDSSGYDVSYSQKHEQYFFHNSGHGGEHHEDFRERTGPIETLSDFIDTFDAVRGRVHYCEKCESMIPRDNLCDHLEWDKEDSIVVNRKGEIV